jgi:ribose transport system permease protein
VEILPILILLLLFLLFGILTNKAIFSNANLKNIFEQALITAIATIAISFVYTTGNIDISIGSIICVSCVFGGRIYERTGSVFLMLLITTATGLFLVNINGLLSSFLKIKPMVVAIVMMSVYQAIAAQVMGPVIMSIKFNVVSMLQNSPLRIILFLVYLAAAVVVFHFTKTGRQLRFLGGNERCAKTVGINRERLLLISYLMTGVGIGIAATCTLIRTGTVSAVAPATGTDVMLATILGGMSIFGGHRSKCYAGVIGSLLIVVLNKGLLMVGVSNEIVQGIRGIIFIAIIYMTSEKQKTIPSRLDF